VNISGRVGGTEMILFPMRVAPVVTGESSVFFSKRGHFPKGTFKKVADFLTMAATTPRAKRRNNTKYESIVPNNNNNNDNNNNNNRKTITR
jgi:hypothetical protein